MDIKPLDKNIIDDKFKSLTDAIIIFHKELCPHCKNMEKVLNKFSAKNSSVTINSIDSEAHEELMKELDFERVPTLVFIKNGEVAHIKSGLMNPKELKALYAKI